MNCSSSSVQSGNISDMSVTALLAAARESLVGGFLDEMNWVCGSCVKEQLLRGQKSTLLLA